MSKVIKKKNVVSRRVYAPLAINWVVNADSPKDTFKVGVISGSFVLTTLEGYRGAVELFAHERDTYELDLLIKELTNFRETIKNGK